MTAISALMLTTKARWWAQQLAIETWLLQKRGADDELVIVTEDIVESVTVHPQIRVVPCEANLPIATKRNLGVEACVNDWVALWDDDDWHGVRRYETLRKYIAVYDRGGPTFRPPMIVGATELYWHELVGDRRSYLYQYPIDAMRKDPYVVGGTMAFDKALWRDHPFETEATAGDEGWWTVKRLAEGTAFNVLPRGEYVAMLHHGNSTCKMPRVSHLGEVLSNSYMQLVDLDALCRTSSSPIPSPILARYAAAAWAQSGEQE